MRGAHRPRPLVAGLLGAVCVGMSILPSVPGVGGWSHPPALAEAPRAGGRPTDAADGSVALDDRLLTADVRFDRSASDQPSCQWSQFTGVDPVSGRHSVRGTQNHVPTRTT